MATRDLAVVAFRTMAVWLFASGITSVFSGLMTWQPDVQQYGQEAKAWQLAAAALFVPIGAILWIVAPALAGRSFEVGDRVDVSRLSRADLYAFAIFLTGLFLLADAVPQVTYWIVVWRSAGGTGFWAATQDWRADQTVVYWVHTRAQVGLVVTQLALGIACLLGPERLGRGMRWLRGELSDHLQEEPAEGLPRGEHGA